MELPTTLADTERYWAVPMTEPGLQRGDFIRRDGRKALNDDQVYGRILGFIPPHPQWGPDHLGHALIDRAPDGQAS